MTRVLLESDVREVVRALVCEVNELALQVRALQGAATGGLLGTHVVGLEARLRGLYDRSRAWPCDLTEQQRADLDALAQALAGWKGGRS